MLSLGRDEDVLVSLQAEVDEGGVEVQRVCGHHVEESRVLSEHPLEQPLGGSLFALAWADQLDVQDQRQILPDQMADHSLVIVFPHRFSLDRQGATLAVRAPALPAGKELVAVDCRHQPALTGRQGLVPFDSSSTVVRLFST